MAMPLDQLKAQIADLQRRVDAGETDKAADLEHQKEEYFRRSQYEKRFRERDSLKNDVAGMEIKPYEFEFNSSDMFSMLDDINKKARENIARTGATARESAVSNSAQSLASRGITGGSVVDDARAKATNPINTSIFNAMEKLGENEGRQRIGIADSFNRLGLSANNAYNRQNLGRYGLLSNIYGQEDRTRLAEEQLQIQKDAQPGVWDDILSVLGIAGTTFAGLASAGLFSSGDDTTDPGGGAGGGDSDLQNPF